MSTTVPAAGPWPPRVRVGPYVAVCVVLIPVLLATAAFALQHGPLDLRISRAFVDGQQRFHWADSRALEALGHEGARLLPIVIGAAALLAGVAGFASARLRPWRWILLTLGAAMILGPVAVNKMKAMTTQHCPVEMLDFGGRFDYLANRAGPFWAASPGGSRGDCLPSGHAGGGYALLALFFAGWAAGRPAWRWGGLAIGVAAGLGFSLVRVVQGAHFASATVWSAAVVWAVCALVFLPLLCGRKPR